MPELRRDLERERPPRLCLSFLLLRPEVSSYRLRNIRLPLSLYTFYWPDTPPQLLDFGFGEITCLARLRVQNQRPIANPANLLDVVSDFLEHFADFAVAAFNQREFVPWIFRVAKEPDLRRSC